MLSDSSRKMVDRLISGAFTSKNGFSVVAPIRVMIPASTAGSRASCWLLLKRWTSSRNRMVPWPLSTRLCRADSMTSRTSLTPAVTAESDMNWRFVWVATTRASVVFPVPGGPHRMIDESRSVSISARSGAPGPTRCRWPTMSSSVCGRMRAASGACCSSRSCRADSNSVSGWAGLDARRAGTPARLPTQRFLARLQRYSGQTGHKTGGQWVEGPRPWRWAHRAAWVRSVTPSRWKIAVR